MGARFEVVVPQVEEVLYPDDPRRTVAENAVRKNRWCRRRYPGRMILTADTALDFRGRVMNKPASLEQAAEFLRQLSGESHKVLTAVGASDRTGETDVFVVESGVTFKVLVEDAIREYFRRVDPLDKAGAYDIDQSPELIIASYCGSRTNIMGLPAEAVGEWLGKQGAGSADTTFEL